MGRQFRGSEYHRETWISKRTVKEGEALLKWNWKGKATAIIGPARVRCRFATIEFMDRVKASPFEYLRIEWRDGQIEHLPGPRSLWKNPVRYEKITVEPAIHLATKSEAIIIYYTSEDKLARNVVKGPATVCPRYGERVHNFAWTQYDESISKQCTSSLSKVHFQSLKVSAPSPHVIVAKLNTNDGPSATLRVSLTLVIHEVEKLIDNTDDLPMDLANALESDLIVLGRHLDASSLRNLRGLAAMIEGTADLSNDLLFLDPPSTARATTAACEEEMKQEVKHQDLPQVVVASNEPAFRRALLHLCRRCEELGVEVRNVELRGLDPSPELTARWRDQDARLKSQLAAADAKLKHEASMAAAARQAEMDVIEAERETKALERQHLNDVENARRALELDDHKAAVHEKQQGRVATHLYRSQEQDLAMLAKRNDETIRFLSQLKKDAGVDITTLLTAQLTASSSKQQPSADSPFDLTSILKKIHLATNSTTAVPSAKTSNCS